MTKFRLRKVVYQTEASDDGGPYQIAVTREKNGSAVYRLEGDEPPVLTAWFFNLTEAIDHVLGRRFADSPRRGQNLFQYGTIVRGPEELARAVYRRDLTDARTLVVTKEINGFLLLLYPKSRAGMWAYGMFPDSTSAIDDLVQRTRGVF